MGIIARLRETHQDLQRLHYLNEMLPEQLWPMLTEVFCSDRQLLRVLYEQEVSYQLRKSHGGYGPVWYKSLAAMASSTLFSPFGVRS